MEKNKVPVPSEDEVYSRIDGLSRRLANVETVLSAVLSEITPAADDTLSFSLFTVFMVGFLCLLVGFWIACEGA